MNIHEKRCILIIVLALLSIVAAIAALWNGLACYYLDQSALLPGCSLAALVLLNQACQPVLRRWREEREEWVEEDSTYWD